MTVGKANYSEEKLEQACAAVKSVSAKILELRQKNGANSKEDYIFGSTPTMLDGHVLPALARICDVGKKDLLAPELVEWVEHFRQGPVWKEVVPGYSTLPK